MKRAEQLKEEVAEAGKHLFTLALEGADIKNLVAGLPLQTSCQAAAVEYELRLLQIIATGWSISFFLDNTPWRDELAEIFWKQIYEFSAALSETTKSMTGHELDYFTIINERLDSYVAALQAKPQVRDPAAVIGPEFARFCGNEADVFAILTGTKMFLATVVRVKDFLDGLALR